ncbi:MAG TPA: OmpA family protein [Methylomirabilota bacterium]|nr:OmpA family protein [Methylomirabilota bacterium]
MRVVITLGALAMLIVGCARHAEGPPAAGLTAEAPAAPPPAPVWPDAAAAPEAPTEDAAGPTGTAAGFSARENLPDLHFASGRVDVQRSERNALDAAATWLKANPEQLVILEGYTDVAGPQAANLALARRRAKWVMDYLVGKGIAAGRITVVSRGESEPLCAERSAACQGRNRRVRFLVRDTGPVQVTASPSR